MDAIVLTLPITNHGSLESCLKQIGEMLECSEYNAHKLLESSLRINHVGDSRFVTRLPYPIHIKEEIYPCLKDGLYMGDLVLKASIPTIFSYNDDSFDAVLLLERPCFLRTPPKKHISPPSVPSLSVWDRLSTYINREWLCAGGMLMMFAQPIRDQREIHDCIECIAKAMEPPIDSATFIHTILSSSERRIKLPHPVRINQQGIVPARDRCIQAHADHSPVYREGLYSGEILFRTRRRDLLFDPSSSATCSPYFTILALDNMHYERPLTNHDQLFI